MNWRTIALAAEHSVAPFMKYKTALMTASAFLLISAPALAADVPSDAAVKAIASNYALFCPVLLDPEHTYVRSWFGAMAPDYADVTVNGKEITKRELTGEIEEQIRMFHAISCDNSNDPPTAPDANTVVVVDTSKLVGIFRGEDTRVHDVDVTQKREDTWKLTNGSWMLSSSKDLRMFLKIDGTVQEDEGY